MEAMAYRWLCATGAVALLAMSLQGCGGNNDPSPFVYSNLNIATDWDRGGVFSGYVGCFADDQNDRKLPIKALGAGNKVTPEVCNKACHDLGHKYFGLQWYRECWCGDGPEDKLGEKSHEGSCFYPCEEDESQTCGGAPTMNSVYKVDPEAKYQCSNACKCIQETETSGKAAFCVTADVENTNEAPLAGNIELGITHPNADTKSVHIHPFAELETGKRQVSFLVWETDLPNDGTYSMHLGHAGENLFSAETSLTGKFTKKGHYLTAPQCPGSSSYCDATMCCPGVAATGGKSFPCPIAQFDGEHAQKCESGWEAVRDALMAAMTRDEKHRYLKGTGWFGEAFPKKRYYIGNAGNRQRFGLVTVNMQDSGNGFRNDVVNTGTTVDKDKQQVTSWPVALALASLWSENAMTAYGQALAKEFRLKGANMLLGPAVNVHRVPRCGRNAEYLSGESPYLGLRLTKPYIRAVQSERVLASVKHFINNNQESCRHTSNSITDNRTRWELYYPPFEAAVEADVAAQMCGYNLVNGDKNCQSYTIMNYDLKQTMGFKGFVQSDWWALNNFDKAIEAGIDQEMPGHPGAGFDYYFSDANLDSLSDAEVNRMLKPQLELMLKYRLLEVDEYTCEFGGRCDPLLSDNIVVTEQSEQLSKDTATKAVTLLKNDDNTLPLNKDTVKKIALVGKACHQLVDWEWLYGSWTRTSYYFIGGSGRVVPHDVETIYQGLQQYCPGKDDGLMGCYREEKTSDGQYERRMKRVLEGTAATRASCRAACQADSADHTHFGLQWEGECYCGSEQDIGVKVPLGECQKECTAEKGIMCGAGNKNNIYRIAVSDAVPSCEIQSYFGDDSAEAIAVAAGAEIAFTCGGAYASESWDRVSLKVGCGNDGMGCTGESEFIEAVAAGLKDTMPVVVLTMTPGTIVMPWANNVKAMMNVFFPGKYAGSAFAANIFGDKNPSAKSPIFYPVNEETDTIKPCDCAETDPARPNIADCTYTEGLNIAWYGLTDSQILFPFGHGLSYTTYAYTNLMIHTTPADVATNCPDFDADRGTPVVCVTATVTNNGARAGDEIAQLYLGFPAAAQSPARLLKGFNRLEGLETTGDKQAQTARFPIHTRDVRVYKDNGWKDQDGVFNVFVGSSAKVTPLTGTFTMASGAPAMQAQMTATV